MYLRHTILMTVLATSLAACASSQPSAQLQEARQQYHKAKGYHASELDLVSLHEAEVALEEAEGAYEEDPGSFEEVSLAYIAERKAQLAMANAGFAYARQTTQNSQDVFLQLKEKQLEETTTEVNQTKEELRQTDERLGRVNQELQEERQARSEAERRAVLAMRSLQDVAKVKAEEQNVVITLDGSVMFLTGKSDLLPIARDSLSKVAKTISDIGEEAQLRIVGHTDSRGEEGMNMQLSRERAQSVADFLASQGIDRSRLTVIGKGESEPVAPNDTPAGRASNRRVEIIVQGRAGAVNAPSTMGTTSGQQQQQPQQQQ